VSNNNASITPFKELIRDKFFSVSFILMIIFFLVSVILIFMKINSLPPQVPLFYSQPWGLEQLASKDNLFLIPVTLGGILLINLILSLIFWNKSQFLTKVLIGLALICSFLTILTLIQILLLVGN